MNHRQLNELIDAVNAKREEGYNCAEGVLWGVSQALKLDIPVSSVTGFGGGVAGTGSVCGALSGAIVAVSTYVDRTEPDDVEGKDKAMALSRKINDDFVEQMGTQLCYEILGAMPGSQPPKPGEGINPKCVKAVEEAVKIALEVVWEDSEIEKIK